MPLGAYRFAQVLHGATLGLIAAVVGAAHAAGGEPFLAAGVLLATVEDGGEMLSIGATLGMALLLRRRLYEIRRPAAGA